MIYGIALLLAYIVDALVKDVTEGDVKLGFSDKVLKPMKYLGNTKASGFYLPSALLCWSGYTVQSIILLVQIYCIGGGELLPIDVVLAPYYVGQWLTPLIILCLAIFISRTFAKGLYITGKKVNKLNRALKDHMNDDTVHNKNS